MTKKKRLLSLLLAVSLVATIAPWASLKASASFTGALQFDTDGKFTVMQIADIQVSSAITVDSRVTNLLKNAIARYHPDLCVFTGDNQTGGSLLYKGAIDKFLAPLIDSNTKFAVTFGNHEEDGWPKVTKQTQYDYYKSKGGNNFIDHDVSSLSGVGSGAIPIYPNGQTSGTPAFQVYLMDSGMYASSGYDCPYTDQVDYYINRSITYPDVPSLWYMHIIVPDVYTEVMSGGTLIPEKIDWAKSAYGTTVAEIFKEQPCPAELSTYTSSAHRSSAAYGSKTLYESWVAYGNMLGTYYGHDHKNSFVSTTDDGIDIGYGKAPTLESYNDGNPGCRIYELDADGTYTTFNVTESDLTKAVINFDANGGTGYMLGQLSTKNSISTLNANAYTRPGYTFEGWAISAGGSVEYPDSSYYSIGTADVTLYAKWLASGFSNITFNAGGGIGGTGPTSMQFETTLTAPIVTKTGYTFTEWLPSVPATVPSVDTTYIAHWAANTYTVNYNENGGTGSTESSTHNYDELKALTNNGFSKTGYTFAGWSTNPLSSSPEYADGQSIVNLTADPGASITLYAIWSVNQYLITFDANGGTGGNSGLKTFGTALTAPTVSKTGYTFTGWSPAVPASVPAADTIYTAQWSLNQVIITFDANGGSGGTGPVSMSPGSALLAPEVTKTGFTFTGWSPEVPATVPSVNQTFIAQWAVNNYNITFDANGGTGGGNWLMQYGAVLTAPEVFKTGYNFSGWSPSVPGTVPAGDTIYTAQWNAKSYTITFDANGGTGGTSGSFSFGATIDVPSVFRAGYTFTGWTPEVPQTVPAENRIFTAQWTLSKYTLTFDAGGGTGSSSVVLLPGEPVEAPLVVKTGYTFAGWSPAVPAAAPAENTTYTALWSINSYRITFQAAGGLGGTSAMQVYDSPLVAPTVTRYGYVFTGWAPEVPETVPAEDTTFTAQWTPASFLITFDANGGIGGTSAVMEYGSALIAPDVTRPGFTLTGWLPSVPATVPAKNATYKAQWTPVINTITFDAKEGSTTVIDRNNNFIYGLKQGLTQAELEGIFVNINGNGRLVYTPANGTIGTGTKIELVDNATNEVIQTYMVVIFGDVSGDGIVNGIDAGIIINVENYTVAWDAVMQAAFIKAGDVNGDGSVNGMDSGIIVNSENYITEINQATGLPV